MLLSKEPHSASGVFNMGGPSGIQTPNPGSDQLFARFPTTVNVGCSCEVGHGQIFLAAHFLQSTSTVLFEFITAFSRFRWIWEAGTS